MALSEFTSFAAHHLLGHAVIEYALKFNSAKSCGLPTDDQQVFLSHQMWFEPSDYKDDPRDVRMSRLLSTASGEQAAGMAINPRTRRAALNWFQMMLKSNEADAFFIRTEAWAADLSPEQAAARKPGEEVRHMEGRKNVVQIIIYTREGTHILVQDVKEGETVGEPYFMINEANSGTLRGSLIINPSGEPNH